jgi:hypothetical protein
MLENIQSFRHNWNRIFEVQIARVGAIHEAVRARRVPRRFSGVFIRGEPPNKKTTRQRNKTLPLPEQFYDAINLDSKGRST